MRRFLIKLWNKINGFNVSFLFRANKYERYNSVFLQRSERQRVPGKQHDTVPIWRKTSCCLWRGHSQSQVKAGKPGKRFWELMERQVGWLLGRGGDEGRDQIWIIEWNLSQWSFRKVWMGMGQQVQRVEAKINPTFAAWALNGCCCLPMKRRKFCRYGEKLENILFRYLKVKVNADTWQWRW